MPNFAIEVNCYIGRNADGSDKYAWSQMRPSGGRPYRYQSRDEAERMAQICYPLSGENVVRVTEVSEDEEEK